MRVVFMGTPEFSVVALDAIVAAGHEIAAVYTQPPRAAGRGMSLRRSPVHARAEDLGIEVRTPERLKGEAEAIAALEADIAVVVAYGLILPQAVLDAPRRGCLNIHASLLPRWRGAAPIQRAIMAGDAETGVAIMQMEAGLDTGPVRLERRTAIGATDTFATLHDRLAQLGGAAVVEVLAKFDAHPAVAQPEDGVTYAEKIQKSEAAIDWTLPAAEVDRHIRGLSPFPGAWTEMDGARLKCLMSEAVEGAGAPGVVITSPLTVACGDGAVRLLRLQRAGKAAADVEDVLRGFEIPLGTRFGG